MRKGNKKEKWEKPRLLILTTGKPEEEVLSACKHGGSYCGTCPGSTFPAVCYGNHICNFCYSSNPT